MAVVFGGEGTQILESVAYADVVDFDICEK